MTFAEFEQRYQKEMKAAQDEFEAWLREQEEEKKNPKPPKADDPIFTPTGDRYNDAEFLLEQLLLASTLMTVAMHHLTYYANARGKDRTLDKNDQVIMQRTADEIEAFINLMEGEGICTEVNKG